MDEHYSFDVNLDFLDSAASNTTQNITATDGYEQVLPAYDVESLATRIASVNDLTLQLKTLHDQHAKLQKQMHELSESALSIRSMYEREKAEKVKFSQLAEDMREKCAQAESQLTNKTLHFEQLTSRMKITTQDGPIPYDELIQSYQKMASRLDEDKLLGCKAKILLQQVEEYMESKRLPLIPKGRTYLRKQCQENALQCSPKKESKNQATQCTPTTSSKGSNTDLDVAQKETCSQGTQYTWYTTTRGTNTPASNKNPQKEARTQGTQYISSTTTRATCTSAFIKKHNIGTNFPEVVPVSIEDIFKEMICDVSPLSPMRDSPQKEDVPQPPPVKQVELKSLGTNTELRNVRKPIDYVVVNIKRSDSRPPSRNMYERVKNESPFMGMPMLNPFAPLGMTVPPLHNNVTELWNMLGHTIFALLQNGTAGVNPMQANVDRMRSMNEARRNNQPRSNPERSSQYFCEDDERDYPPSTRNTATSPIPLDELRGSDNYLFDRGFNDSPFVGPMYSRAAPTAFMPVPCHSNRDEASRPIEIQKILLNPQQETNKAGVHQEKPSRADDILKLFPKDQHSSQKRKDIKRLLRASKTERRLKKQPSLSHSSAGDESEPDCDAANQEKSVDRQFNRQIPVNQTQRLQDEGFKQGAPESQPDFDADNQEESVVDQFNRQIPVNQTLRLQDEGFKQGAQPFVNQNRRNLKKEPSPSQSESDWDADEQNVTQNQPVVSQSTWQSHVNQSQKPQDEGFKKVRPPFVPQKAIGSLETKRKTMKEPGNHVYAGDESEPDWDADEQYIPEKQTVVNRALKFCDEGVSMARPPLLKQKAVGSLNEDTLPRFSESNETSSDEVFCKPFLPPKRSQPPAVSNPFQENKERQFQQQATSSMKTKENAKRKRKSNKDYKMANKIQKSELNNCILQSDWRRKAELHRQRIREMTSLKQAAPSESPPFSKKVRISHFNKAPTLKEEKPSNGLGAANLIGSNTLSMRAASNKEVQEQQPVNQRNSADNLFQSQRRSHTDLASGSSQTLDRKPPLNSPDFILIPPQLPDRIRNEEKSSSSMNFCKLETSMKVETPISVLQEQNILPSYSPTAIISSPNSVLFQQKALNLNEFTPRELEDIPFYIIQNQDVQNTLEFPGQILVEDQKPIKEHFTRNDMPNLDLDEGPPLVIPEQKEHISTTTLETPKMSLIWDQKSLNFNGCVVVNEVKPLQDQKFSILNPLTALNDETIVDTSNSLTSDETALDGSTSSHHSSEADLSIECPQSPKPDNTAALDLSMLLKTPEKQEPPQAQFKTPDSCNRAISKALTNSTENLVEDFLQLNDDQESDGPKFQVFLDKILNEVATPISPISVMALTEEKSPTAEAESSCDENESKPRKYKRKAAATAAIAVKRSARLRARYDADSAIGRDLQLANIAGVQLGKYTKKKTDPKKLRKNLEEVKKEEVVEEKMETANEIVMGYFRDLMEEEDHDSSAENLVIDEGSEHVVPKCESGSKQKTEEPIQMDWDTKNVDINSETKLFRQSGDEISNKRQPEVDKNPCREQEEDPPPGQIDECPLEQQQDITSFVECPASPAPADQQPDEEHITPEVLLFEPSKSNPASNSVVSHIIANYNPRNHQLLLAKSQKTDDATVSQLQATIRGYISGLCLIMDSVRTVDAILIITNSTKLIADAFLEIIKTAPRPEAELPPPVPKVCLSETLRKVTSLFEPLHQRLPNFRRHLSTAIEQTLFTFVKDVIPVEVLMNLTQCYLLIIADPTVNSNPARLFICKCLYFFNHKATPMIYETLCAYPTVLPKREDFTYDRSDALISTIQCLLNSIFFDLEKTDFKTKDLLIKLRKFYNYESFKPPRDEVLDNLMAKIRAGRCKNVPYALALLCKRMAQPNVEKFILTGRLIPLANEYYHTLGASAENDEKIACTLECISFIIKPFTLETDISTYVNLFARFLNASERQIVQEAAVAALLRTVRFGYVNCFNAIYNFKPNYELSDAIKAMLQSFIYKKNLGFLEKLEQQARLLVSN